MANSKNFDHVSHIKSKLTREVTEGEFYGLTPTPDNSDAQGSSPVKLNLAKRPTSDKIIEGEIAVNYKKGHETLTIKNDNNEIVGFVNENEFYQSQAILANGIAQEKMERMEDIEKIEGKINENLGKDLEDLELVVSSSLNDLNTRLIDVDARLVDDELTTSAALNDLNARIIDANEDIARNTERINKINNEKIPGINLNINTLDNKVDRNRTELLQIIDNDSLTISSSLNDLNDRIKSMASIYDKLNRMFLAMGNGYVYVDLGLPSGTLWATKNIGAASITDYGQFFAWGEILGYFPEQIGTGTGQRSFNVTSAKYGGGTNPSSFSKYNLTDMLTRLQEMDDAAHENMGGLWHIPTLVQLQELMDSNYTDKQWVTDYEGSGKNVLIVTSKFNGNQVIFPAAGHYEGTTYSDEGVHGCYWLKDVVSQKEVSDEIIVDERVFRAHLLLASQAGLKHLTGIRTPGRPIRAVIG